MGKFCPVSLSLSLTFGFLLPRIQLLAGVESARALQQNGTVETATIGDHTSLNCKWKREPAGDPVNPESSMLLDLAFPIQLDASIRRRLGGVHNAISQVADRLKDDDKAPGLRTILLPGPSTSLVPLCELKQRLRAAKLQQSQLSAYDMSLHDSSDCVCKPGVLPAPDPPSFCGVAAPPPPDIPEALQDSPVDLPLHRALSLFVSHHSQASDFAVLTEYLASQCTDSSPDASCVVESTTDTLLHLVIVSFLLV